MRLAVLGLVTSLSLASCTSVFDPHASLPVETISIDTRQGRHNLTVEIAADPQSHERGLMYRREMAPDAGMLFDFHQAEPVSFWMKNTILPLDMVFIRADGTISSIEPNAVPFSTQSIPSAEPVRAVLEINGGRAHDLGIKPGDRVHSLIFENEGAPGRSASR